MTTEQLREHYNAQPFHPFTVHLADGKAYPVASREFLALSPTGRTFTVYDTAGVAHVLDLLLVTELEVPPVPPNSGVQRQSADLKWIQVKTHMANLEPLPREFRFNLRSIFVLTAAIAALFAAARFLGIVLLSTIVLFVLLLVDACLGTCLFSRIRRRVHQAWDTIMPPAKPNRSSFRTQADLPSFLKRQR